MRVHKRATYAESSKNVYLTIYSYLKRIYFIKLKSVYSLSIFVKHSDHTLGFVSLNNNFFNAITLRNKDDVNEDLSFSLRPKAP